MEWWQIPIQGKNYDTSWDLNKGSPKISKMHTSKKVDSVDSGIRRQFWTFRRKIVWDAKSIKTTLFAKLLTVISPKLCPVIALLFYKDILRQYFLTKFLLFWWFMHFYREMLSWEFTRFFLRFFWTSKQNPQTLSFFGCICSRWVWRD